MQTNPPAAPGITAPGAPAPSLQVRIQLRTPAASIFGPLDNMRNELVIRFQPGEAIYAKMVVKKPGLDLDYEVRGRGRERAYICPPSARPPSPPTTPAVAPCVRVDVHNARASACGACVRLAKRNTAVGFGGRGRAGEAVWRCMEAWSQAYHV